MPAAQLERPHAIVEDTDVPCIFGEDEEEYDAADQDEDLDEDWDDEDWDDLDEPDELDLGEDWDDDEIDDDLDEYVADDEEASAGW